jgi:hypothetical protein
VAVNASLTTSTTSGSVALAATVDSATVSLTATGTNITEAVVGAAILGTTFVGSVVTGIDVDTTVTNITASGAGDIVIDETKGATLQNVDANNGNATAITASGNLTVIKVDVTGTATLTATTGSIIDGDGATVDNMIANLLLATA